MSNSAGRMILLCRLRLFPTVGATNYELSISSSSSNGRWMRCPADLPDVSAKDAADVLAVAERIVDIVANALERPRAH